MERKLLVLGITLFLAVGAVAVGEPCVQLDQGSAGGHCADVAEGGPTAPIVVCPGGVGSIDGVRAGGLAQAGATVASAESGWLFTDSGLLEPNSAWDANDGNQPVSVWLSRADCLRADSVTTAIGEVSLLVLFEPPELFVPDTDRFPQIVVVASDAGLASRYSAVAELYRGSGLGDSAFVVLNDCAGRKPPVERTVVTLLTSSAR